MSSTKCTNAFHALEPIRTPPENRPFPARVTPIVSASARQRSTNRNSYNEPSPINGHFPTLCLGETPKTLPQKSTNAADTLVS